MPRLLHGAVIRFDTFEVAGAVLAGPAPARQPAALPQPAADLPAFDFLLPDLQNDPANLLPTARRTRDSLIALGRTMRDPGTGRDPGDSDIPAIYTYFGQFIDHDITLEAVTAPPPDLLSPNLTPLPRHVIPATLKNLRSSTLDLDSVYGRPAPLEPGNNHKLKIGSVVPLGGTEKPTLRPPGKRDTNDLPREPPSPDPTHDRAALIGDPRNDENLIVSQLHLAFLLAHNALVDSGKTFTQARRILRQHYQYLVLRDFLPRVCDPAIVDAVLRGGNRFYNPEGRRPFMPLEFSVAAFRFGHSMARAAYDFNLNFNLSGEPGTSPAFFELLFTFTALSGEIGGFETLPDNWIVEWENLVDAGRPFNRARRFDTKLVEPLFGLVDVQGVPLPDDQARLAVRNLLRGYLLRLPTGQAVAQALGFPPLSARAVETAAASDEQVRVLRRGAMTRRTPLWFYLLAEASVGGGQRLGPVGSTIVAEVLVGLARRSADSILGGSGRWRPSLPAARRGTFTLADLLRFAGVLPRG